MRHALSLLQTPCFLNILWKSFTFTHSCLPEALDFILEIAEYQDKPEKYMQMWYKSDKNILCVKLIKSQHESQ